MDSYLNDHGTVHWELNHWVKEWIQNIDFPRFLINLVTTGETFCLLSSSNVFLHWTLKNFSILSHTSSKQSVN